MNIPTMSAAGVMRHSFVCCIIERTKSPSLQGLRDYWYLEEYSWFEAKLFGPENTNSEAVRSITLREE